MVLLGRRKAAQRAQESFRLAEQAQRKGDPQTALGFYEQVLSTLEAIGPGSTDTAAVLNNMGMIYLDQGNLDLALSYLNRALSIDNEINPTSKATAIQLSNIGAIHRKRGELQEALSLHKASLEILENLDPQSTEVASALTNLGVDLTGLDLLDEALRCFERALAIDEVAKPRSTATAAELDNIGGILKSRGDLDQALHYYERALAICREVAPRSTATATILDHIGGLHQDWGALDQALTYREHALSLLESVAPASTTMATTLNNIGLVYRTRGDLTQALSYYERALAIRSKVAPRSSGAAVVVGNIGFVHRMRQEFDEAISAYELALKITEDINPESISAASILSNLGMVHQDRGDLDQAMRCFERAVSIAEVAAPDSEIMARSLNNVATIHQTLGNLDRAGSCFNRALTVNRAIAPESMGTALVLGNIGALCRHRNELDKAIAHCSEAVGVIEAITAKAGGTDAQEGTFAQLAGSYRTLMECLFERNAPGDHSLAFFYAERSRARTFAGLLSRRTWRPTNSEEQRLIETQMDLRQQLARIVNRQTATGELSDVILGEELAARRRLEETNRSLRQAQSDAQIVPPEPLDLTSAQAVVGEDTVVLEYAYGVDGVFCFVVQRNGFAMVKLSLELRTINDLIESALEPFRQGNRGTDESADAIQRLSEGLLGAIPEKLWDTTRRLLVLPDDVLHAMPFEVFTYPGGTAPLGSGLPVTYSPSLSIYAELLSRTRPESRKRFAGFAPTFTGRAQAGDGDPSWWELFGRPGPLRGARDEVSDVAALLGDLDACRLGPEATEYRFKIESTGCRYLHVATHGVFQTDGDPLYTTGLLLDLPSSDDPVTEAPLDDFLQTDEMFNLDLTAEVVVLSACQSGLGRLITGEGVIGMSRAILLAGARCLVVALWPVADLVTQELMVALYEALSDDVPAALALHSAREQVRSRHPDPYYWAGFVCVGAGW